MPIFLAPLQHPGHSHTGGDLGLFIGAFLLIVLMGGIAAWRARRHPDDGATTKTQRHEEEI